MTEPSAPAKHELAERIRTVALEEFAARGYGVSLQQIAERSGCTKANVLYHFGSKEELFRAVLAPVIEASRELERRLDVEPDFDPARGAAELMVNNRHAVRMLVFHHRSLPDAREANFFLDIIQRVAAKLAPNDPSAPTRAVVAFIGIAYVLSVDPEDADAADFPQFDVEFPGFTSLDTIAQLVCQLTLAPSL